MKKSHLFLFIICSLLLSACSLPFMSQGNDSATITGLKAQSKKHSLPAKKQFFALDTLVTITLYQADPACDLEEALSGAEALCKQYENLFSRTIEGSDIWGINHADGSPVKVSEETLYLIKNSIVFSEATDGKFDITIAPVIDLWDETESLPDKTALKKALSVVSYKNIEIDDESSTVTLKYESPNSNVPNSLLNGISSESPVQTDADPESLSQTDSKTPAPEIDLGAVAKGYIADKLKEYLKEQGVTSALLDLGGNILALGEKEKNAPFTVAVKMPFTDTGSFYTTGSLNKDNIAQALSVTDKSVVTSGIYERYREIDGKLYHHILDPGTGYPVDNSLASVTIISEDSLSGDLLSTSCLLIGKEAAAELVESLPGIEAVYIEKDGTISYSSQIGQYLL